MSTRDERIQRIATEVTKKWIDEGKIIEAGFAAFGYMALKNVSAAQRVDMRVAFLAGAEHLFSSIVSSLDPDKEPTPEDERRMIMIGNEVMAIRDELMNWAPIRR